MSTEAITLTESKRLIQLEKQITESVFSAGEALKEIRDKKLYRADFDTFEEYCREKWGYTRQRGYQLIEAFEVKESLPQNVNSLLTNESQARELSKIPPRSRPAVLKKIEKAEEPITASTIAAHIPPPRKTVIPPKSKPAEKPKPEIPQVRDEIGRVIPDALLALWERRHEVKELINSLSRVRTVLKDAQKKDALFAFINSQSALLQVENALQELKHGLPHSLCPDCHGKNIESCTTCRHTGFIGKLAWDVQTPEETKQQILKTIKK